MSKQYKSLFIVLTLSLLSFGADAAEIKVANHSEFPKMFREFMECREENPPDLCISKEELGEAMCNALKDEIIRAGECKASCGSNVSVTCEGTACYAQDGVGCSAIMDNGEVSIGQCAKEEEPYGPPPGTNV